MPRKSDFFLQDIPQDAGVYVFRNSAGEVIYVGKAKNLRQRLGSYFQPSRLRTADIKLRALLKSIEHFEVTPVRSEAEAMLLESRLIKQYNPRYNIELRDDKRFLLLCIDPQEPYPRLTLTRLKKDDGRLYFGPFPRAGALRQTALFLTRRFGLRACPTRHPDQFSREHCLESTVRFCARPCGGDLAPEEYQERVRQVIEVLQGKTRELEEALEAEMLKLAQRQRYEEAAKKRDILENLRDIVRVERMRSFERATLKPRLSPDNLQELQNALGLSKLPETIECFDVSNIGGHLAVASMVRFQNGKPAANNYRRFRIRTVSGSNDFAMIAEAVARRYRRITDEQRRMPDLIVIDGGIGQLNAALAALTRERIEPVPVLGLAKKHEEIWLPGRLAPLVLPAHHAGLKVLQAIRDEAHRFALSYHHKLRRQRIANSILGEIEGIGPARQQQLIREFGSVRRLEHATPEEVAGRVPGIGLVLAQAIIKYLREHQNR